MLGEKWLNRVGWHGKMHNKFLAIGFGFLIAFFTIGSVGSSADLQTAPGKAIEIGSRLELFVDWLLVDKIDGVEFRLHHIDSIEQKVSWKNDSALGAKAGRPVRLRFVMSECDLYSFRFSPTNP